MMGLMDFALLLLVYVRIVYKMYREKSKSNPRRIRIHRGFSVFG